MVGSLGPGPSQLAPGFIDRQLPDAQAYAQLRGRRTDPLHAIGEPVRGQAMQHRCLVRALDLQHRARLLGEQRCQCRSGIRGRRQRDIESAVAGESHLEQRHEYAPVGAVVVGQHQPERAQLDHRRDKAAQQQRIFDIRGRTARRLIDLRECAHP